MSLPMAIGVRGEPCDVVVELLANALAEAKAGRVSAVIIAYLDERGFGAHSFAHGEEVNLLTLLGATGRASARLLERIDRE